MPLCFVGRGKKGVKTEVVYLNLGHFHSQKSFQSIYIVHTKSIWDNTGKVTIQNRKKNNAKETDISKLGQEHNSDRNYTRTGQGQIRVQRQHQNWYNSQNRKKPEPNEKINPEQEQGTELGLGHKITVAITETVNHNKGRTRDMHN